MLHHQWSGCQIRETTRLPRWQSHSLYLIYLGFPDAFVQWFIGLASLWLCRHVAIRGSCHRYNHGYLLCPSTWFTSRCMGSMPFHWCRRFRYRFWLCHRRPRLAMDLQTRYRPYFNLLMKLPSSSASIFRYCTSSVPRRVTNAPRISTSISEPSTTQKNSKLNSKRSKLSRQPAKRLKCKRRMQANWKHTSQHNTAPMNGPGRNGKNCASSEESNQRIISSKLSFDPFPCFCFLRCCTLLSPMDFRLLG